MVTIRYQSQCNTLIMEFSGKIEPRQTETMSTQIQQALPNDIHGFKLVTDLTGVQAVDRKVMPSIKKAMDLLNQRGVREIIRVIPDPAQDIGLNIMSAFHYSPEVSIVTVKAREEANERMKCMDEEK